MPEKYVVAGELDFIAYLAWMFWLILGMGGRVSAKIGISRKTLLTNRTNELCLRRIRH
ncbi:hypothetical protein M422DRAFT_24865 [Sphaerobolus stellatus SS14]|nr:hypothetical protein M422DRAFT_24865 [Sphaerobolus stellatus SS14]